MRKFQMALYGVFLANLLAAGFAWADLTLTQKSTIKGADVERVLQEKVFIKGRKMRLENTETGKALVVDLRAKTIYQIDSAAGEYFAVPFLDLQVGKDVVDATDSLWLGLAKLLYKTQGLVTDIQARNSTGLFAKAARELRKEHATQAKQMLDHAESEQDRKTIRKDAEKELKAQMRELRSALHAGRSVSGGSRMPAGPGGMLGPGAFGAMGPTMGTGTSSARSAGSFRQLEASSIGDIEGFVQSYAQGILNMTLGGGATVELEKDTKTVVGFPCKLYAVVLQLGASPMMTGPGMIGPPGMMPGMMPGGMPGPMPGGMPGPMPGGMPGPMPGGAQPKGSTSARSERVILAKAWVASEKYGNDLSPLAFLDGAMGIFRPAAVAAFKLSPPSLPETAPAGPQGQRRRSTGRAASVPAFLRHIPLHSLFMVVLKNDDGQYEKGTLEIEVIADPDFSVLSGALFAVKGLTKTEQTVIDYWD